MTSYRLFPSTSGPSNVVPYTGPFSAGVVFEVTTGGIWFEGYWWWVCPSGQATAPQTFALWQIYGEDSAFLISVATVTSGPLTAGQWNYVELDTPIMLSIGGGANFSHADAGGAAIYLACTSFSGGFPDSDGQYGFFGPYSGGITDGPLTAFSDVSGSLPAPFLTSQSTFGLSGNVTTEPPLEGSASANFWMDVQVSDAAPDGYSGSYRIWPSLPVVPGSISNDTGQQTSGTEFWLSGPCTLDNIWFWSPPGVDVLPSRCGIFGIASQSPMPGTDNAAPAWSGAPGSGWVACSYAGAGVVLPAGKYKTCVYYGGGSTFYQEDVDYFGSGPGAGNIVNGPITCPATANSASAGNSAYSDGPWSYPNTFDSHDDGESRFIDVEVTPVIESALTAKSSMFLIFFP